MRIIGGKLKGLRLQPPNGLPSRPTTDRAKEALFNILNNEFNLEGIDALDLFSGTGNIALELVSRSAASVTAVETSYKCCSFIKQVAQKNNLNELSIIKEDVFKFIKRTTHQYDFIFADPPFDLPDIQQIPLLIFEHQLLKPDGLFILEHPSKRKVDQHANFIKQRDYGFSAFSFYENNSTT